jgi:hypothetical protein
MDQGSLLSLSTTHVSARIRCSLLFFQLSNIWSVYKFAKIEAPLVPFIQKWIKTKTEDSKDCRNNIGKCSEIWYEKKDDNKTFWVDERKEKVISTVEIRPLQNLCKIYFDTSNPLDLTSL